MAGRFFTLHLAPEAAPTGPVWHPTSNSPATSALCCCLKPLGALPSLLRAPHHLLGSCCPAIFFLLRLKPPPSPSPLPLMSHCLEKTQGFRECPHLQEMIPEQEKGPRGEHSPWPCPHAWVSPALFSVGVKGLELGASSLGGKVALLRGRGTQRGRKGGKSVCRGTPTMEFTRVVWGLHRTCYHLFLNLKR